MVSFLVLKIKSCDDCQLTFMATVAPAVLRAEDLKGSLCHMVCCTRAPGVANNSERRKEEEPTACRVCVFVFQKCLVFVFVCFFCFLYFWGERDVCGVFGTRKKEICILVTQMVLLGEGGLRAGVAGGVPVVHVHPQLRLQVRAARQTKISEEEE